MFKFKYFTLETHIAKKFYWCLFGIEIVRIIIFSIACYYYKLGVTEEKMEAIRAAITGKIRESGINYVPKPLFIFLILPDFLFIIAFLLLFWQLLSLYKNGHANLFKIFFNGKGKYLMSVASIGLSAFQIMMLLLYLTSIVSATVVSIGCTMLNILSASFVLCALLAYVYKFSGSPYKS